MTILNEHIREYIEEFTVIDDPILMEMEEFGKSTNFPYLEPECGQVLKILAAAIGARRIFELGSGFGYSAAWFLQSLPPDGEMFCTDYSEENIARGRDYLERLGARGRVTFLKGDAVESLNKTGGTFDIIYNDIDKESYPRAFEAAVLRLRPGGLFISDNALWKGKIVEPNPDEKTRAIQEYNEMIFKSPAVISTIIPLRDGLSVSLKV